MDAVVLGGLSGFGAAFITFLFLVAIGLHSLFAKNANSKLLRAARTAFGVMLGYIAFFIAHVEGTFSFSDDNYAWLGPTWIITALVLALLVYGVGDKSDEDQFGSHLDKSNKWG